MQHIIDYIQRFKRLVLTTTMPPREIHMWLCQLESEVRGVSACGGPPPMEDPASAESPPPVAGLLQRPVVAPQPDPPAGTVGADLPTCHIEPHPEGGHTIRLHPPCRPLAIGKYPTGEDARRAACRAKFIVIHQPTTHTS